MSAYKSHFHEKAHIAILADEQVVRTFDLETFIRGQELAHARSSEPMNERMLDFDFEADGVSATANVRWELVAGERVKRGVDRFVLLRIGKENWKIVSLTFYESE